MTTTNRASITLFVSLFLSSLSLSFGQSSANVLTYHNDNLRTGANLNETQLTWSNVAVGSFGKLFQLAVDGVVYAQPLYVSGLKVNGATHNVLFVATENNSIYAFDADSGGSPLWQVNFNYGPSGTTVTPVPDADIDCTNLAPVVGITSTPVINRSAKILYTVAKTKEVSASGTNYYHRLHGVNIQTGAEVFPQVEITATIPGTCGTTTGSITFDPLVQHQRASLLFLNGVIYVGSASHCDLGNYYGWLLGYSASTQKQVAALNFAPDATTPECRAGIWQGGGGPTADSNGNIFLVTANGAFNASKGGKSYGDSALKLSTTGGTVNVADYFTPMNQQTLNNQDLDFGGSGPMLLPPQPGANPDLMVAAGKFGTVYLINRDNMGKFHAKGDSVVQSLPSAVSDGKDTYPPPVYFNETVYYAGSRDSLKAFTLQNGVFSPTTPVAVSQTVFGYLGAGLSVSASPTGDNGIVWALDGTQYPGSLHAYNASTLDELYNTSQAPNKADEYGGGVKLSVPTIANGKVYVGTQTGVAVFGLKSEETAAPTGARTWTIFSSLFHSLSKVFRSSGSVSASVVE